MANIVFFLEAALFFLGIGVFAYFSTNAGAAHDKPQKGVFPLELLPLELRSSVKPEAYPAVVTVLACIVGYFIYPSIEPFVSRLFVVFSAH